MFTIQTLNKISEKGLGLLDPERFAVKDDAAQPEGIILRSHKMHDMTLPESLLAVARAGAGVNNIPIESCTDKGIVVFNTPGANANSVKELVISGMLLSSRKIVEGVSWARNLKGESDVEKTVEKGKKDYAGPEIMGKTLGVIGLGAIGVMVANAAADLGMNVLGFDPYISVDSAWGLSAGVRRAKSLEAAVAECDFISIHVPLLESTKGMVDSSLISRMKDGVRILNFARGPLVNDADIITALESGKVAKYITDFPNAELLNQENVLPIPHLGASTPEAEENCAVMASRQLADYLSSGNIKNSVNFPSVEMEFSTDIRLVILNRNVPSMVGQITSVLADEKINISDMINKHRDEVAVTIIDVDGDISPEGVKRLEAIEGVIRARVIKK
ncbi:phosphoglycerate dehydrogenase [Salinispira pacifica]|uniref:D-3-phosphoglycerate dehydrogenase n=1 Tax=Salinispira pacifica TaxID=1307761 RepID=V5WCQ2_9SPIO|nr:phosphoglycerate dehydrogenase [Salinispira pacifica]AHC13573.1 D-3-phosphoglycerate dehydrogenase [Salinispira pacifica]